MFLSMLDAVDCEEFMGLFTLQDAAHLTASCQKLRGSLACRRRQRNGVDLSRLSRNQRYCDRNLTAEAIKAIATKCPRLTSLDVSDASLSIKAIAANCHGSHGAQR